MRRQHLATLLTIGTLGFLIAGCDGGGSGPAPTSSPSAQATEPAPKKTRTILFRGSESGYRGLAEIPIQ